MKILHLNSTETSGGAGRAANRLHRGLQKVGIQSRMLVSNKQTDDWSVYEPDTRRKRFFNKLKSVYDSVPLYLYSSRKQSPFSTGLGTKADINRIHEFNPDIVHMHWIGNGFFSIENFGIIGRPIVWTFHDMWPFTGGCHYDEGCRKYEEHCGSCPQLGSDRSNDLSRRILRRKKKHWNDIEITIVTPSNWLAGCVKNSSLFGDRKIHVIPNGLDTEIYKPMNKESARKLWSLPEDKKYILFGAINATSARRKGLHILNQALKVLHDVVIDNSIELIIFGATNPQTPHDYGFKVRYMGELHDDISLASLYSAVDVFVAPSTQDNLPNTVIEAMSCSVPVVAFEIGGMPDMIDHMKNGYLAQPFNPDDLASGINWVLEAADRYRQLAESALCKARQSFGLEKSVEKYTHLYNSLSGQP
jgi:glycosyltransferase involved in cell wall biosynthesis